MAWTAPQGRPVGYDYTHTLWNSEVVDNVNWLGRDRPCVRVYRTSTTTHTDASTNIITWQASSYSVGSMWSSGTNPSRITAQVAGWYMVGGNLAYSAADSSGTGGVDMRIKKNGTTGAYVAVQRQRPSPNTWSIGLCISTLHYMAVNDYIEMEVVQTNGSTATLTVASGDTGGGSNMWACWVRDYRTT